MRPVQHAFQKLSRTEQRREGVAAYLCPIWTLLGGGGGGYTFSRDFIYTFITRPQAVIQVPLIFLYGHAHLVHYALIHH